MKIFIWLIFLIFGIFFTGCKNSTIQPTTIPTTIQKTISPIPTGIDATPTNSPSESGSVGKSETPAEVTELIPTPTLQKAELLLDTQLHATDSSSVELASGEVQLVEFFAFWCGTCREMAPILHGLEAQYGDRMSFIYLDADDAANGPFKSALGYRDRPHLFLLDGDGKVLRQWVGFVDGGELQSAIEAALP